MREAALQITVIICLIAVARQQSCADISKYNRSTDGDICLIGDGTEFCRWKQEQGGRPSWERGVYRGESSFYVPMNAMSETDAPVKLLSSELCRVPRVTYNFSFQYDLGNKSNCELTVLMKKGVQYNVLWNSSRTSDHGARQNASLSNATCDCEYQIVFEVRKYNRKSCGSPAWDNFIAIRYIGYTPLPTTTAPSPPQPTTTTKNNSTTATATTATTKTTPQRIVDPGTSSVTPFHRTGASSDQSQTNPTRAATTPGSPEGFVSTYSALINDNITPAGLGVAKDGTLNVGAAVGVVLGVLAAVIVVVIFVVFIRQRKMNSNKSCAWMSKSMNPKPGGTARAATNSAYTGERGNNGPTASSFSTTASQPVYEFADATHLQEYANLQYPRPLVDQMGYQIPCQPQSSRRYQESGLEESVLDESNYDITEDAQTGNYYSVPHDATSDNSHSTTTNPVAATTALIRQPKGDNVYELADKPNVGRNRVLPEDSYNKLSHLNPRFKAPVPKGTRFYDHIGNDVRNKTAPDSSEYSLANAGDNVNSFASHQHTDPSSRRAGVAHILADAGTPVDIRTNAGTLSHNPASMNTHSDIFALGGTTADILAMAGTPVSSGRRSASPCQDDPSEDSDPCYSQIGEALAKNKRSVPEEGNEYSLAKTDSNAESNVLSSTRVEVNCGVDYSLGRAHGNVESAMSSPQPQQNTWSQYSLAGAHDNTDIAATSAAQAHVHYYNTVDFNTRANVAPLEEYNSLNFDFSESKGGDKRDRRNDGYSHVVKGSKAPNTANTEKGQSDYVNDNHSAVYHVLEEQSE